MPHEGYDKNMANFMLAINDDIIEELRGVIKSLPNAKVLCRRVPIVKTLTNGNMTWFKKGRVSLILGGANNALVMEQLDRMSMA